MLRITPPPPRRRRTPAAAAAAAAAQVSQFGRECVDNLNRAQIEAGFLHHSCRSGGL